MSAPGPPTPPARSARVRARAKGMEGMEGPAVLPYLLVPAILVAMSVGLLLGGAFLWTGALAYLVLGIGTDTVAGEQGRAIARPWKTTLCKASLYAVIPLTVVASVLFANAFSPSDPLGAARLATAITAITGPGLVTPPAEAAWWQLAGAIASMGAIYAAASGIAGHELMHRLNRARDLLLARVLLAFCLDTPLAIEHVYGHHRTVGTPADPTTAPRGMSFWRYLPRSVLGGNRNAWRFEAARLARSGRSRWSWRNRVLASSALSLLVPAAFYAIGGWLALLAFLAAAANGKIYIEAFNYIGHYGLVRVPGTPAAARHSWNSYRIVTNGLMFNLPRHSSHHLRPTDPYWRLQRQEAAPQVPFGMNLMALIALVPPLWHRIMNPLLADWDARFATGGELELVRQSGWRPRPVALS